MGEGGDIGEGDDDGALDLLPVPVPKPTKAPSCSVSHSWVVESLLFTT